MFVKVVRLRFRGRRLPRPALKHADAFVGFLHLDRGKATLHLTESSTAPLLGPLFAADVTKIRLGNFLVAGTERFGVITEEFPQVWWCRLMEYPCTN